MRLATLLFNDEPRVAAIVDDRWFDLSRVAPDMLSLIRGGEAARQAAQQMVEQGMSRPVSERPSSRPSYGHRRMSLHWVSITESMPWSPSVLRVCHFLNTRSTSPRRQPQ